MHHGLFPYETSGLFDRFFDCLAHTRLDVGHRAQAEFCAQEIFEYLDDVSLAQMILARQHGGNRHEAGTQHAAWKRAAAASPARSAKTCKQAVFGHHRLDRLDIENLPTLWFHINRPHYCAAFAPLWRFAIHHLIDLIGRQQVALLAVVSWLTSGASALGLMLAISSTIETRRRIVRRWIA
jgi:hypothetical protein